jgi:hypothetical protein
MFASFSLVLLRFGRACSLRRCYSSVYALEHAQIERFQRENSGNWYKFRVSVLCDLDLITVLDTGGFGLRPLASCGLGRFSPMLDPDIDAIKDNLKTGN